MKIYKNYLVFAVLFFVFSTACYAQAPTPTLSIAGLKDSVTVRRDGRGIPYIEAKNEADLYFAQGFVTAQDRLWQMDLFRRVARGETAEIFGKIVLEEDRRWRKFGFAQIAEESWKLARPEIRTAMESYARGVNAYLATLDEKSLPPEFQILQFRPREWKPTDSIVIGAIFADALSTTWQQDLLKGSLQNLPKEKLEMLFEPSAQDDVLLFGKDTESPKSKVQSPKSEISNNKIETLDF
jgi:penicillin G amidase